LKIILGSTSEPRAQVMRSIVPEFEVMDPGIDEKAIRHRSPQILTSELAVAKSRELRKRISVPALLITADTVVTWNGMIREKPENADQARLFLRTYREGPATCVTAVLGWNSWTNQEDFVVDEAKVWFQCLTDYAIEHLVQQDVVYTGAGGFAVGHEVFAPHIGHINGERSSAMGLPRRLTEAMIESLSTEE
jgi:septum formation protein